ncbi:TetR-family transcription regulator [Corynebacterium humireducens NBRC 106098 = DSM 45392]|uniref:TetR-family transcription regulator n=1 Tax=Corynebacterium humireducens NBRC 106098 = DSM 45392 TaxID=1223515 RepID=A0A0B5DBN1_9CORY|nr:TetR family transcriptional regulator [Corynebacterium humireducens]AJE33558.1 TetR-family transcription regulator [Corynebacterium humireducens NBRC 106098 = DSM 45392]
MQLTRESIVTAAVAILDTYGLADMTMRRVATSLGVAPGALYWHIANKQQLIAAIAEEILTPVLAATAPRTAPELAGLLRESMLSRRDGAELVAAALSQPESETREVVEKQLAATLEGDADLRRVGAASLLHLVLGATALEQARAQHAADTGVEKPRDASGDFHRGVELMLAGLDTARA